MLVEILRKMYDFFVAAHAALDTLDQLHVRILVPITLTLFDDVYLVNRHEILSMQKTFVNRTPHQIAFAFNEIALNFKIEIWTQKTVFPRCVRKYLVISGWIEGLFEV